MSPSGPIRSKYLSAALSQAVMSFSLLTTSFHLTYRLACECAADVGGLGYRARCSHDEPGGRGVIPPLVISMLRSGPIAVKVPSR